MLALIAALCFLLALLKVTLGTVDLATLGTVDLVTLGLFFVALHLAFGAYVWSPWRRP